MIESSPQLNYDLMTKAVPLMDKPEIGDWLMKSMRNTCIGPM